MADVFEGNMRSGARQTGESKDNISRAQDAQNSLDIQTGLHE